MTNEQYIQVAEKVWGMRWPEWWHEQDELIKEVNSWQGFGRTVEAMLKKHYWFEPAFCTEHQYDCISFVHETLASYPIHYERNDLEEFIEATHLAALEAVLEGKK